MTKALSAAMIARTNKALSTPIRTTDYGVVTYQELVTRRLAEGGSLEAVQVPDEPARDRLRREYDRLNRGFNVPWGNDRHPTTIRAQAMKDKLAGDITTTEYRLVRADRDHWTVIPKLVFDWANKGAVIAAMLTHG